MKIKLLLFGFTLFTSFSFAQNPLMINQATSGSSSTPGIGQIVVTKSGYTFYNTVDDSNPFTDIWGLWISDGTPTGTKKLSLNDGKFTTTEATMLTPFGDNKILFAGDNSNGYGEVWVSDGTQKGTFGLQNFMPGSDIAPVLQITAFGNKAIYTAVSSDKHLRLHITSGSAYEDTASIYDFGENVSQTGGFATLTNLKSAGDFVLFRYWYWGVNSPHDVIWRSDGSLGGTFPLIDLGESASPTGLSLTSDFLVMGNHTYFTVAEYGSGKTFLYQTDGTVSGTKAVTTLSDANAESGIHYSAAIGSDLYFDTDDGIHGRELWKTDGTAAGTAMVADINPGVGSSTPAYLTVLNNVLYFRADDGVHGNELWKYDPGAGTEPELVKDISPGATGSNPSSFAVNNNTIVFSASSIPGSGPDLWVSDGSAENTLEIKGPEKSTGSSLSPYLITSGEKNYFAGTTYDFTNGFLINKCLFVYTPPDKIWTGSVSDDSQDGNNWFPAGVPSQTDNVLLPENAANPFSNPYLFCNDFINNGSTVNVGNGLILLNGNFFNSGTVNNPSSDGTYYPGVFALASSGGSSYRTFGNTGTFNGQLTLSSNINLHLTTSSYIEALRVEGVDSVFLGPYQLTVDKFPILVPVVVLDSSSVYSMEVGSNPVTFPIMAYGSYTPVTITNHSIPGYFNVSMKNGIFTNGTSGNAITSEAVNKTWLIEPATSGNANADITLQWNASDELPGFDRSHIYLNHYTSGAWDPGDVGVASGTGPFTFSRNGITSFSPFSVTSSSSALPLNLISFTANKSDNAVQLNWQTNSEKNFSFFSVERSKDGIIFSKLDEVHASFSNSLTKNYSYTDNFPLTGTGFYRLKMVDADAKFTYSKIVAVRFDGNNALQIFPNPAKDILHVQVTGSNENALLQIIDITGRKVKEQRISVDGTTSVSVDINDLPKGMYHLLFKTNSKTEHQKFVKQ